MKPGEWAACPSCGDTLPPDNRAPRTSCQTCAGSGKVLAGRCLGQVSARMIADGRPAKFDLFANATPGVQPGGVIGQLASLDCPVGRLPDGRMS